MAMPQERIYTSEDYWNLPDGQRAELIDGKLYAMALSKSRRSGVLDCQPYNACCKCI